MEYVKYKIIIGTVVNVDVILLWKKNEVGNMKVLLGTIFKNKCSIKLYLNYTNINIKIIPNTHIIMCL